MQRPQRFAVTVLEAAFALLFCYGFGQFIAHALQVRDYIISQF